MRKTAYYIPGFHAALLYEGDIQIAELEEEMHEHVAYDLAEKYTKMSDGEFGFDPYSLYSDAERGLYNPTTKELVHLADSGTDWKLAEGEWRVAAETAGIPIKRFGIGEYSFARDTYDVTWIDQKPIDPTTENSIYLKDLL